MSPLRRGFKAEANRLAREIRRDLRLNAADPVDPRALAQNLAIPLVPLSALKKDAPAVVRQFSQEESGVFSALTMFYGTRRAILYNDSHSPGRQASDIAHELSHALLQHPPEVAIDHRGRRNWNQNLEDEATWLAGALLISDEAAIEIAKNQMSTDVAAVAYGVSEQMIVWRLNVTAAVHRVGLSRKGKKRRNGGTGNG